LSYNINVGFEVIEHTADIGIVARGKGLEEAFANAALGLFSLITDLDTVREMTSRELAAQARDPEGLLVEWLNGLIYLFDVENLLFSRFEFQELLPTRLAARAYGEKADLSRHPIKMGVKAATHHMLKVEKGDGYLVQVLFDI
jgi:SHS2 domain-containing protein